jgi:hypothetical protein
MPYRLTVLVNGIEETPAWAETPVPGERFATASFTVSPDQLARIAHASRVGRG